MGIATASEDSVCYNVPVTLTLTGYIGTVFQWQRFNGISWVDEAGAGSTTDTYTVSLVLNASFRALVTASGCPPSISNEVSIVVGTIPVPTAPAAGRCGPGTVNLQGTGAGTLEWFTAPTGGTAIAVGSNTTAFIPA